MLKPHNGRIVVQILIPVLLVTIIAGCIEPPNGVIAEKEILIADTNKLINSEEQAVDLATSQLQQISGANLIRIPGEIDRTTLAKIYAQEFKRNGEQVFQIYLEYTAENDTGKLTVIVTKDGKIYGTASED